MKQEILHDIKDIAKSDFTSVSSILSQTLNDVETTVEDIRYNVNKDVVTATCNFQVEGKSPVEATILYEVDGDEIYADSELDSLSDAILGAIESGKTRITAADEDVAFDFEEDEFDRRDPFVDEDDSFADENINEEEFDEELEEFEDPEEEAHIEVDNNIAGHYIAECSRCHGIFISALVESDQQVELLSGICPLCEKESDQYIKWIVKPVEFGEEGGVR